MPSDALSWSGVLEQMDSDPFDFIDVVTSLVKLDHITFSPNNNHICNIGCFTAETLFQEVYKYSVLRSV